MMGSTPWTFSVLFAICWVVCGVVYAICGLLQNVQPHYDFSQVMHLPHLVLILLYVEAVLTPFSG